MKDFLIHIDLAWLLVLSETKKETSGDACGWKNELGWLVRRPLKLSLSFKTAKMKLMNAQTKGNLESTFQRFGATKY